MKRVLAFGLVSQVLVLSAWANSLSPGLTIGTELFSGISGRMMSVADMRTVNGTLVIVGNTASPTLRRFRRRQRVADPSRVHCDILAQNRAADMGLDTRNQNGSVTDYNKQSVSGIYEGFPNNRHDSPPAGTAGYFFTSYGEGKEHMGVYSRPQGSDTYARYWNDSYQEHLAVRSPGYRPEQVLGQVFIPLPPLKFHEIYHR